MQKGEKYIAKTPSLVVTNIRGSKETVVTMPTVSVKERGTDWKDSETFTTTQHCCEGRGPDLKTAMDQMWEKWEKFSKEAFGETIFVEKSSKNWSLLTQ